MATVGETASRERHAGRVTARSHQVRAIRRRLRLRRNARAGETSRINHNEKERHMSENLIESVAPQLAPPVTREPVRSASEADAGTDVAVGIFICGVVFADDDAE